VAYDSAGRILGVDGVRHGICRLSGASAACSSWSACSWGAAVASASSADSTTNDLLRGLRMVAGVRADFLFAAFLPLRVDASCGEDCIAFCEVQMGMCNEGDAPDVRDRLGE